MQRGVPTLARQFFDPNETREAMLRRRFTVLGDHTEEFDMPEWQTAIGALVLVARSGPTMMARIGVMKALNRHVERVFNPDRKDTLCLSKIKSEHTRGAIRRGLGGKEAFWGAAFSEAYAWLRDIRNKVLHKATMSRSRSRMM
jgi:hypothetical protein